MITSESLIELNLRSTNKSEIIEDLATRAQKAGHISDINGYLQAVSAVEERHSTVINYGVAMPRGKSSCVESPFFAFARSDEMFPWDIRTSRVARFIFLIGVPVDHDINLYLNWLNNLCRGSKRGKILKANSTTEAMTAFREMGLII